MSNVGSGLRAAGQVSSLANALGGSNRPTQGVQGGDPRMAQAYSQSAANHMRQAVDPEFLKRRRQMLSRYFVQ